MPVRLDHALQIWPQEVREHSILKWVKAIYAKNLTWSSQKSIVESIKLEAEPESCTNPDHLILICRSTRRSEPLLKRYRRLLYITGVWNQQKSNKESVSRNCPNLPPNAFRPHRPNKFTRRGINPGAAQN